MQPSIYLSTSRYAMILIKHWKILYFDNIIFFFMIAVSTKCSFAPNSLACPSLFHRTLRVLLGILSSCIVFPWGYQMGFYIADLYLCLDLSMIWVMIDVTLASWYFLSYPHCADTFLMLGCSRRFFHWQNYCKQSLCLYRIQLYTLYPFCDAYSFSVWMQQSHFP